MADHLGAQEGRPALVRLAVVATAGPDRSCGALERAAAALSSARTQAGAGAAAR
jgi:hypothetical protein